MEETALIVSLLLNHVSLDSCRIYSRKPAFATLLKWEQRYYIPNYHKQKTSNKLPNEIWRINKEYKKEQSRRFRWNLRM